MASDLCWDGEKLGCFITTMPHLVVVEVSQRIVLVVCTRSTAANLLDSSFMERYQARQVPLPRAIGSIGSRAFMIC